MQENLAHFDDDCELGNATVDAHTPENFGILHQAGLTIHAQGVVKARDDEQETDTRIGENVYQRVEAVVTGTFRYRQRIFIKDLDEADRVAAWADIGLSIRSLRADAQERRTPDEALGMLVE